MPIKNLPLCLWQWGKYQLLNEYDDYRISIDSEGIYEDHVEEPDVGLRQWKGLSFFTKDRWNDDKHTQPVIVSLGKSYSWHKKSIVIKRTES